MKTILQATVAVLFLAVCQVAHSVVIDDFEVAAFSLTAPGPNMSVHQSVTADHVIGGHRTIFTYAYNGPGSETNLLITDGNDGVKLSANQLGFYWMDFQYDGPGTNAFNLNFNLLSEDHNAFFIDIAGVTGPTPPEIAINIVTHHGEPGRQSYLLFLPVLSPGSLMFPFSTFAAVDDRLPDDTAVDFQDVDCIWILPRLPANTSMTIADIRTGIIPEPTAFLSMITGVLSFLQLRFRFSD